MGRKQRETRGWAERLKRSAGTRVQNPNLRIPRSGGEPSNAGRAASPVRNLEELSSSSLILFPNVRLRSNLTLDQLNVLIFQYLRESGFPHTAFCLEREADLKNVPIDKSTIPRGAIRTFVQKGLRFTQLQANLHASNVDRILFSPLDPLDIITNKVPRLGEIIEESAKRKRNNDGGEGDESRLKTRSNKQKIVH